MLAATVASGNLPGHGTPIRPGATAATQPLGPPPGERYHGALRGEKRPLTDLGEGKTDGDAPPAPSQRESSPPPSTRPPPAVAHVIDLMLAERAPRLLGSPVWPLLGPLRDVFFGYRQACALADALAPLGGQEALDYVSELLHLKVAAHEVARLPVDGPCIIVANHPTGIADGVALYDAVKTRRPDVRFFANADAERICPRFGEVLIPVVWPARKRTMASTRRALGLARDALREGRVLAIFAAGVMSKRIDGIVQDPPWEPSAVTLARKHRVPVVPVHVAGPYSFLFHLFHRISQELRDITLFHEFMNKAGRRFTLTFGEPVDVTATDLDNAALTVALKRYTERQLPAAPHLPFAPDAACRARAAAGNAD